MICDAKAFLTFSLHKLLTVGDHLRIIDNSTKVIYEIIASGTEFYNDDYYLSNVITNQWPLTKYEYDIKRISFYLPETKNICLNSNSDIAKAASKEQTEEWLKTTVKCLVAAFNKEDVERNNEFCRYMDILRKAMQKGAMFDSRCFNIPKDDVCNCILWRQNDATRNSIEMVGHANFSQNQLHKKSCNEIQDMLMLQKGINWNDFPTTLKRGSCCIREQYKTIGKDNELVTRSRWIIDNEIPIFKGDGRNYIESLIYISEV